MREVGREYHSCENADEKTIFNDSGKSKVFPCCWSGLRGCMKSLQVCSLMSSSWLAGSTSTESTEGVPGNAAVMEELK